jgi:hypothetical protein
MKITELEEKISNLTTSNNILKSSVDSFGDEINAQKEQNQA